MYFSSVRVMTCPVVSQRAATRLGPIVHGVPEPTQLVTRTGQTPPTAQSAATYTVWAAGAWGRLLGDQGLRPVDPAHHHVTMHSHHYLKLLCGIAITLTASASLVGCKTLPTGDTYTWVDCATEGQLCRTGGPTQVRYGARGRYEYRSTNGPIWCGNDSFGDPAPGLPKHCQVQAYVETRPAYPGGQSMTPHASHWEYCAREDSVCHAPSGATVRFGANGRYAYVRNVNGPVSCSKRAFGDPIYGIVKSCEYGFPRR